MTEVILPHGENLKHLPEYSAVYLISMLFCYWVNANKLSTRGKCRLWFVVLSLKQSQVPCCLPWIPRAKVYSSQFCLNVLSGSFLDSTSPLLAIAACTALGEIGRNGPLPIPSEGSGFTKLHLVESLLNRIPSSKETNKASFFFFPSFLKFFLFVDT